MYLRKGFSCTQTDQRALQVGLLRGRGAHNGDDDLMEVAFALVAPQVLTDSQEFINLRLVQIEVGAGPEAGLLKKIARNAKATHENPNRRRQTSSLAVPARSPGSTSSTRIPSILMNTPVNAALTRMESPSRAAISPRPIARRSPETLTMLWRIPMTTRNRAAGITQKFAMALRLMVCAQT